MEITPPATKQADRTEKGTFAVGNKPKTSFADRPQDRSPGGWKKENVFSYQFKRFMNMTRQELTDFAKTNDKGTMTMAEHLALKRILAADKSLPDFKEIADRTEGKAAQSVDLTTAGQPLTFQTISFADADDTDTV